MRPIPPSFATRATIELRDLAVSSPITSSPFRGVVVKLWEIIIMSLMYLLVWNGLLLSEINCAKLWPELHLEILNVIVSLI